MTGDPERFARVVCRACGHGMRQQQTRVMDPDGASLQQIAGRLRQVRRTRILYYVCPACGRRVQDAQTDVAAVL